MSEALAVAERFFHAIEEGDIAAVAAIYAPDATIWHNNDGVAQSVTENLQVLGWMVRHIPHREYRVLRRVAIPGGFLQQHVLHLSGPRGQFDMPACIVAMVRDGHITQLEEYLDSAQVAGLRRALGI